MNIVLLLCQTNKFWSIKSATFKAKLSYRPGAGGALLLGTGSSAGHSRADAAGAGRAKVWPEAAGTRSKGGRRGSPAARAARRQG